MSKTFTIEGEWSGYTSAQCHVVHREHTRSKKRADAIRDLGSISYTDGTRLRLRVIEGKSGKPISGYGSLIGQCLAKGVNSVAALQKAAS